MRMNLPVTGIERLVRDNQSLISRTNTGGRITYVNQAFVDICGFTEDELIGAPHNLVRHPDMPPEAFADFWSTLKSGHSWTGMVKNRCKNGDHYWVLANATPIRENGVVTGYTSVRTAPSREQVQAAEKIYARFKDGRAGNLRIRQGQVVRSGPAGWLSGLLHLHIKGKLCLVMGMFSLFMLAIGIAGLVGINHSSAALQSVYEDRARPLEQLDSIARLLMQNHLIVAEAIIRGEPGFSRKSADEIEGNIAETDRLWQAYLLKNRTSEEIHLADEFQSKRKVFVAQGLRPAAAALRDGNFEEARRLEEAMPALAVPARSGIDALIKLQLDVVREEIDKARDENAWMRNFIAALLLLSGLLGA